MKLYLQPVQNVFQTNAYFYINEVNHHGYLIDPGAQAALLLQVIQEHDWHIDAILLTHGHFDHTGAVDQLTKALHIPYYISINAVRNTSEMTTSTWLLKIIVTSTLTNSPAY